MAWSTAGSIQAAGFSVCENERADPGDLANAENWRSWILDLEDGVSFHSGGFTTRRIDGRTFLMVPADEYESTAVFEVDPDGSVEERWTTQGWSMEPIKLR